AEDGIRDFHVTGVQTCALPIFPCKRLGLSLDAFRELPMRSIKSSASSSTLSLYPCSRPKAVNKSITSNFSGFRLIRFKISPIYRSEERRVGKECRCRCARENIE